MKTMVRFLFIVIFLNVITYSGVFAASKTEGVPNVRDADTFILDGVRVRLQGVDAMETNQLCQDEKGDDYYCGREATVALRAFIDTDPISCVAVGRDFYKRPLLHCTVRGQDIGDWLVSNGLALVDQRYSRERLDLEKAAAEKKQGVWRGSFIPPWEWRKAQKCKAKSKLLLPSQK